MEPVNNDRYISVFINDKGRFEYIYGLDYRSQNVIRYSLSDSEFYSYIDQPFFTLVNERCKLLIGSGESEMLKEEDIETCLDIYHMLALSKETVMYKALQKAKEYGLGMGLDF